MSTPSELSLPFPEIESAQRPLADRMRPQALEEIVGQEHISGAEALFHRALSSDRIPSAILWGPPGCGKTSLARLVAKQSGAIFVAISAISHATADIRKIFQQAEQDKHAGKRTVLLVDEIHRFNRAQQDIFLPYVEDGTVILIGATTENPSFEVNSALLSRCHVLTLKPLSHDALSELTTRAEAFTGKALPLDDDARQALITLADGDGRYLLNMCEELLSLKEPEIFNREALQHLIQQRMPLYDKSQDGHYNLISALHKSLRGSDVNAALYWLNRMLEGGEDRRYICRRLIRFASEDIGLADPQALTQAIAAKESYDFLGSPEGEVAIAQATVYLATAPKSNAVYTAYKQSRSAAKQHGSLMPPKHILNAPTALMKQEGYGDGYAYDHDTPEGFSGQNYFPDTMKREDFYNPVERGFEREIKKRLDYWEGLRQKKGGAA